MWRLYMTSDGRYSKATLVTVGRTHYGTVEGRSLVGYVKGGMWSLE